MNNKFDFYPHIKGTTFPTQRFTLENNVDGPVNLNNAIIIMQLKTAKNGPVEFEFSTINGRISITEPLMGKFQINELMLDIPSFKYVYDIEIRLENQLILTPIYGFFTVLSDVSQLNDE